MWKNTADPDRPKMTIWRMRIAYWTKKVTNTHSEYVILLFRRSSGCTNAPQCCIIRTFPVLFLAKLRHSHQWRWNCSLTSSTFTSKLISNKSFKTSPFSHGRLMFAMIPANVNYICFAFPQFLDSAQFFQKHFLHFLCFFYDVTFSVDLCIHTGRRNRPEGKKVVRSCYWFCPSNHISRYKNQTSNYIR
jgi:hypothetical protein